MKIKIRQLFVLRKYGQRRKVFSDKRLQSALNFQDDVGTLCGNQRRIATELYCISHPLLGVQQHCFAGNVVLSLPERLGEAPSLMTQLPAIPPPLIFSKSAQKISSQK